MAPFCALQVAGVGSLERRILEVNRKRVKVVKPGSKTSFPTTEIRGSYAPPFHVRVLFSLIPFSFNYPPESISFPVYY